MGIELGNKVKDIVTGIEGIAVARVEYLNGCVQFCVRQKMAKDEKRRDGEYIDVGQLKFVNAGIATKPKKRPGGEYMPDCPKH